jgi:hypothetical protein
MLADIKIKLLTGWFIARVVMTDEKGIKMNEDTEFVKKKGVRSKHLKECSWYQDDTTCDCDLFSPLGIYAPYIPLQISKIEITNDKESK